MANNTYATLTALEQAAVFNSRFPDVKPDDYKFLFNPGSLEFDGSDLEDRNAAAEVFFSNVIQVYRANHIGQYDAEEIMALFFGPEIRLFDGFNADRLGFLERRVGPDKFAELLAIREETIGSLANGARPTVAQLLQNAQDILSTSTRGIQGL